MTNQQSERPFFFSSFRGALLLLVATTALWGCGDDGGGDVTSDAQLADGGQRDTRARDSQAADLRPLTLLGGIYMLTEIERDPAAEGRCWSTLMQLEISRDRVILGARRYECGETAETLSGADLTVGEERLQLNGEEVGTISDTALQVSLPAGLGSFSLDLSAPSQQLEEVQDGHSFRATVTKMPDERPIALAASTSGTEDEPLVWKVRAARLPDAAVSFAVSSPPEHGTLSSFGASTGEFVYQGEDDFFGSDAFSFTVSDGQHPATEASLTLELTGVSDPPYAADQSLTTEEDTSLAFTLEAGDADGDTLEMVVETPPENGELSGSFPSLTYQPAPEFSGADSFSYHVSDGTESSATVTVSITVTPVNDPPRASEMELTVYGTNRLTIQLEASDVDSSELSFAIASQPTDGTASLSDTRVSYQANPGFVGDDSFTFTASDGDLTSAPATVTIHVLPPIYTSEPLMSGFSSVSERLVANSRVYFSGYHSVESYSLWVTDGTSAGTHLVHAEGLRSSNFSFSATTFFARGTAEYYVYPSSYSGVQLRAGLDGSVITTLPNPDASLYSGDPPRIGAVGFLGDTAYLLVNWSGDSGSVCEIYATDGTTTGTRLAQSMAGGCSGVYQVEDELFFFLGNELHSFTAADETPQLVATITPGVNRWLGAAGGVGLFTVKYSSGNVTNIDLWRTDGTAAGTRMLQAIESSFIARDVYNSTPMNGKLYFTHRKSLQVSDGTTTGTRSVWTAATSSYGGGGAISSMRAVNGLLIFSADTDAYGREPWVYDGSSTQLLKDFYPDDTSGSMTDQAEGFDGLIFLGADDGFGATLWRTDGTPANTERALDIPVKQLLGVAGDRLIILGSSGISAVYRP